MNIKEITLRAQSTAAAELYENEAKGIAVYAAMRMDSREDDMASVPQFVIFMETDAEGGLSAFCTATSHCASARWPRSWKTGPSS